MSSERRSRTCSTGVPRQRRKAVRPRLVAPSVVATGPTSLDVVPLASTSPLSRSSAERAIHERTRARVDLPDLTLGRQVARDRPAMAR